MQWIRTPGRWFLQLEQGPQRIVANMAIRGQPMNKLSVVDVRWFLNLLFLKAGFEVCLFARIGNHCPCLRLHWAAFRDASPSA
jgi:hypothetical protein